MKSNLIDIALQAALDGGKKAMSYYKTSIDTQIKDDGSPVTLADKAANDVICEYLLHTEIQIISEEGKENSLPSDRYWLVDPLDGTKDFLAGNDEFTVNIALIENNHPVLGVIVAPALDEVYAVDIAGKPWLTKNGVQTDINTLCENEMLTLFSSRFHESDEFTRYTEQKYPCNIIPMGSALKYARLATGQAHMYPRLVGTSEWDTAAGQAILERCGGTMIDLSTHSRMTYGKARWRNNKFIAFGPGFNADEIMKEFV